MRRLAFSLAGFSPLLMAQAGVDATHARNPVTFTEHVAPIIFANCTSCHRPGEAAPFSLRSYKEVRKKGRMIRRVTRSRYMPPWHPDPSFLELRDSRRLTDEQIATLARWVEAGMPEGDPHKLPELPEFPSGWQLGQPDMVVTMREPYRVPAGGPDIYRNFVVPLDLEEDRWVTAVEIRPSARSVVHHCLYFLDSTGAARRQDERDPGPGFRRMGFRRTGSLGGWAVGGTPRHLPEGLAFPLRKGSDLILSMHFHPSGKAEQEQTTVGLFFARKPPERTFVGFQVPPRYGALSDISIPAGARNYVVKDSFKLPVDLDIVTVGGHAHYICTEMKATAKLPDGEIVPLFWIPAWDFNWQGRYHYERPVRLPKGTVVEATITWDNSADNPKNPNDPPKRIRWGLQSTDEMGSIIFGAVPARESELRVFRRAVRAYRSRSGRRSLASFMKNIAERLMQYDEDGDGKVSRAELPGRLRRWFGRVDRNGDGFLDPDEIRRLSSRARRDR